MDAWWWIVIAVAVVVVIVVALLAWSRLRRRQHTARLRKRFGPEYDTAVQRLGRSRGEEHLDGLVRTSKERERREVSPEVRDAAWRSFDTAQAEFVDSPVTAVRTADQAVYDALRASDYPVSTVEERASAVAVDQPELAHRYRSAQAALARADADDRTDIGRLREAMLTYRELLQDLLGDPPASSGNGVDGNEQYSRDRDDADGAHGDAGYRDDLRDRDRDDGRLRSDEEHRADLA